MTLLRIKIVAIAAIVLPVVAFTAFYTEPAAAVTPVLDDPAAAYKTKCAMCHSPKAEKAYDPAMPIEEQVQAILKGKKGEKPPYMPAFEPKGMTEDEAKALAEYMQGLRKPAAP
jgi:mono/diheme cytochrome c family protein